MAGASAEGEVNHWPAFVDVLTTVIMVVTFLLVIMSSAVMVLSQRKMEQFKKELLAKQAGASAGAAAGRAKDVAQTRVDAPNGSATAELGDILRSEAPVSGAEQLTIRTRETKDTLAIKVKALEQPEASKGVEVKTADVLLTIAFEPAAVKIDDGNVQKVTEFLRGKAGPGVTYEVWSFVPQTGSVSEAQRLAFYRAAMTRNLLIRAGIAPANILTQARLVDAKAPEGHSVRVVVKP